MKILVTGHLGYIGTVLTPMLLKRGHQVVGMDADWYNACTYGDAKQIVDVPNIKKDIRQATVSDLRGFDTVMHLAALSNDPLGNYNADLTDEINHKAAVRLGELSKEAGVKHFIFSSTCSNYGVAGNDFIDENGTFNPYTPYAKAKVAAELNLKPMSDKNFSVTLMRSATAFGYSPRIRWDLVLNNLTAHAVTTGKIYMKSDGTPWRAIVHIEDISRAFTAVAEAKRELVHDNAFNIGQTKENYRVKEIAEIVAATVPNCRIEYAPGAGPDPRCYRVNCDKLQKVVPAYQPQWSAAAAAKQVYEAIKKNGLTLEEFEGAKYARLPHMKKRIADGEMDERFNYTLKAHRAA
ncbi:MAG TPA: SDR family oxidoreductase [Tepidisphaeraceae bacterium]|nr:SDR family oxidoreductase [Tepidisphaeraceae bacterium]